MCGIAGIVDFDGRRVAREELAARWSPRSATAGPTTTASGRVDARRPRRTRGSRSSTSRRRPPADDERRRRASSSSYNGELYNFRELAAELAARGHRFRSRSDTEVVLRAYRGVGRGVRRALQRHVRVRDLGRARERRCCSPATASASSRSTTRVHDGRAALRLRDQGAARRGATARVSARRRWCEYFTFQNVFSRPARCSTGSSCCHAGHTLIVAETVSLHEQRYWDLEFDPDESRARDASGPRRRGRLRAGRDAASSSATSRSAATSRAAWTRRRSRPSRAVEVPRLMTFTGGFDLTSVEGLELVFDERADAEARRERVPHRALRDGHARGRHGVGAARARLASRGSAGRDVLPEPLHRAARVEVREGRARGHRRRRALRRLSVALRARRRTHTTRSSSSARYYDYWTRLVPDDREARRSSRRDVLAAIARTTRRSTPSASVLAPAQRARSGVEGALLRGEDVPARSARRRGQGVDGAQPRGRVSRSSTTSSSTSPGASRRGSSTQTARASASCARRWRALLPPEILDEAEAGLQPARPVVVSRPDDGLHPGDPARSAHARARLLPAGVRRTHARRASRGASQPPAADLVAAVLRMVEPAVHRRRAAAPSRRMAQR